MIKPMKKPTIKLMINTMVTFKLSGLFVVTTTNVFDVSTTGIIKLLLLVVVVLVIVLVDNFNATSVSNFIITIIIMNHN